MLFRCDPEPDPPVDKAALWKCPEKHFVEGTNLDFNRRVAKALSGMVVAVNLLNIDKTYPGTNFVPRRQRL